MSDNRTFVIAGAGLAGAKAAETLRDEGFTGRVVLLGDEPERPYERPPLSKGLLLGTAAEDSVHVHDADWYARRDVELRSDCPVTAIDRAGHRVRVAGREDLGYDKLLLATGARPRGLPLPGAGLDGVLHLRTLADARHLAKTVTGGAKLVVIGAGWIGLEVAAAARTRGAEVTVVETARLPLHHVLGTTLARTFTGLHLEHGVVFHFGARTTELRGTGRVSHVVLDDGTVLDADAVLVAVGAEPNTALAEQASLRVDNGVLVDAALRTDDPDIFAAGDVANIDHPLLRSRVRVEHWDNALHSGPAAARAMLDRPVSYDRLPYFFTDQYDLGMEYAGWVPPGADTGLVVRGDLEGREFIAFWTSGGRVLAGMNVNVWDVTDQIQHLVRSRATVDPARLRDPGVPLGELVP
ncbi:FAD-dependent oxidoreductase [Couchioplanes caeruleus]|uniref:NAD(P)/FAD-dependent oxidoreductase n=1 Tax=Couchioplanes caeruleus TaxID=56438 RepID=UPI00201BBD38|nr:FAD-dependent oxidoreductase [Couchioplanes caeruleus]UQU67798.1 FAD-dependent oxidoreductase [Couchioplanes caeruleus]